MAVNGKQKGNSFERDISNRLSKIFAGILPSEQSFRRNIDSGAFFGGKNQKRLTTHIQDNQVFGDILTPDVFKFVIECKAYKTPPTFKSIIESKVTQWDNWIAQVSQDSVNSGKIPMLIIKYNNCPLIVGVNTTEFNTDITQVIYYKDFYFYPFDTFFNCDLNKFISSK